MAQPWGVLWWLLRGPVFFLLMTKANVLGSSKAMVAKAGWVGPHDVPSCTTMAVAEVARAQPRPLDLRHLAVLRALLPPPR